MEASMKRTVRRRTFVWFYTGGGLGVWGLMTGQILYGPTKVNGWGSLAGGAFVHTLFITLFWLMGWQSAIRFTDTHVAVTNALVTRTVLWDDVSDVTISNGLRIHLRDRKTLGSTQFGGSLIGKITGYPSHRRTRIILQEALQRARQASTVRTCPVQIATSLTWLPPLLVAAAVYASFLVVLAYGWSSGR
jgi:hypothetical protein